MTKKTYLITNDLAWQKQMKILKRLMPYGIDYLQYRNKSLDRSHQVEEIRQLKILCRLYGTKLIINDRPDLVHTTGADGVHLGLEDMSVEEAFKLLEPGKTIGATAKTVDQARLAEKLGASYLGVGAFYPSSTKLDAKRIDIQTLKDIRKAVNIPVIGIGGLTPDNITPEIRNHVDGFAFSNAIWYAQNPEEVFLKFKSLR